MVKRIGILTGGGDVPGLNSVIKSVVYRRQRPGLRGHRHPQGVGRSDPPQPGRSGQQKRPTSCRSNRVNTRTIDRTGGTFLHSSRTNPAKMKTVPSFLNAADYPKSEFTKKNVTSTVFDITAAVLKNLEKLGIEYLIAIGGDDTLSYAERLHKEGVKVIAIPKTMDNDVRNTEYCIGFSTAISRATSSHQSAAFHRRLARAHRRLPRLRPRRRLYVALYGLRHRRALRHSRVRLRPRTG